jgi:hypothetical protein
MIYPPLILIISIKTMRILYSQKATIDDIMGIDPDMEENLVHSFDCLAENDVNHFDICGSFEKLISFLPGGKEAIKKDNKELSLMDFKCAAVRHMNKVYTLVYGWPGDNLYGIMKVEDKVIYFGDDYEDDDDIQQDDKDVIIKALS